MCFSPTEFSIDLLWITTTEEFKGRYSQFAFIEHDNPSEMK